MTYEMPYSKEAEQAVLGNMIVYDRSLKMAIESGLQAADFYLNAHRLIYKVMETLANNNQAIDITTVVSALEDEKNLANVGGMPYIIELSKAAVTSANTKSYVKIIKNKAFVRNLITTSKEIVEEGLSGQVDVDEYLDLAEKRILNVTRTRLTSEFKSSGEVLDNVIENIKKMADNKSPITGIGCGFRDLDRTTHGFQRGDLIILAARPSMGKTAFALNLAMNVSLINKNQAVAIFSLEMPAEQLISRILSAKSMVKGDQIKTGYLNNNEWNQISEATSELRSCKIFIDDTPGVKTSEIFSKCRKLHADYGLSCIVIDYIQLIAGSGKSMGNRQQEVSEISRNLKALARELEVPVIALSQLSRSVESRENKRPIMSDLRESGALEQDADLIMLLYRDSYYNKETKEKAIEEGIETIEVNIAKHRNGATRTIDLAFKADINAIYNVDHSEG